MIEPIADLPAGVTGFSLEGELTERDYSDVLLPALLAATKKGEVRLLLLGAKGFDVMSLKAHFESAREDPDLDFGHSKDWRRVAIVADANFVIRAAFPAVAKAIPVETKLFSLGDEAEARTWVAA